MTTIQTPIPSRQLVITEGRPYAFEDVSHYSARRIKERFTGDVLIDYLNRLGVRPFEESFYVVSKESPAFLIHRHIHDLAIRSRITTQPVPVWLEGTP